MRVRRLLSDEHEERLKQVTCPRCKMHHLRQAVNGDFKPILKYNLGENYWICSSEEGARCYLLSSKDVDIVFETSEGTKPVSFEEPPVSPPVSFARIIRRRKGEVIDITHLAQGISS